MNSVRDFQIRNSLRCAHRSCPPYKVLPRRSGPRAELLKLRFGMTYSRSRRLADIRNIKAEQLRDLAPQRLLGEPSSHIFDPRRHNNSARSDFDLETEPGVVNAIAIDEPVRQAAVLFPIIARDEPTVLLTQRSATLANHAGQIAFPGGKVEPEDENALATALREAHEEIGLSEACVEPLGYLDNYRTGTGFNVVPVVALVSPNHCLEIDPSEVDITFEVPLSFLMSSQNHHRHQREWRGRMRTYYAMPFGDHYIWGATAGMIRNLYERLKLCSERA